jgi:hypothetical protein
MPVKRRVPKNRLDVFTDDQKHQLFTGRDYFACAYGEGSAFDRELALQHWQEYRGAIMEAYAAWNNHDKEREYRPRPDQPMPWAFYEFEEGEA